MTASEEKPSEIPKSLWLQLQKNDSGAWQELLSRLLPRAMQRIRDGFELPAKVDKPNPGGAFVSAWPSFQKHFLTEKKFEDARDFETLTSHFVRITYNRSQRKKRKEKELGRMVQGGRDRNEEGDDFAFDPVDPADRPDNEVARADFLAYFRQIIDEEVEHLKRQPRHFQIVRLWLAGELQLSQASIAEQVGVHQSTVSKVMDDFLERIRRRVIG